MLKVNKRESGKTLLNFLKENLESYPSVKAIKRAIDSKQCTINGRVEFFSTHKVKMGDEIEIDLREAAKPPSSPILFEDEALILFNKAPGVASESFEGYFLVHRLDKETSGVFLLAKTEEMQKRLTELFAKRAVEKEYLAICDGKIALEEWVVDNYLGKRASYQGGVLFGKVSKEEGKRAVTRFKRFEVGKNATLVKAFPLTGRTHQIRVHLKDKSHPVLGDWQYARHFSCSYKPKRVMLHASRLAFVHPMTGERLSIEAKPYPDFLETQKILFG